MRKYKLEGLEVNKVAKKFNLPDLSLIGVRQQTAINANLQNLRGQNLQSKQVRKIDSLKRVPVNRDRSQLTDHRTIAVHNLPVVHRAATADRHRAATADRHRAATADRHPAATADRHPAATAGRHPTADDEKGLIYWSNSF
jgi:hypothetical protein